MTQVAAIAVVLPIIALHVYAVVVCWTKGKRVMSVLGLVLVYGPLYLVGALRLAKPDSRYALRNYGETKMNAAKARFPQNAANVSADWTPNYDPIDEAAPPHPQDGDWEDLAATDPNELDRITRRAMKKAGRLP
jgi:hypothetical protein